MYTRIQRVHNIILFGARTYLATRPVKDLSYVVVVLVDGERTLRSNVDPSLLKGLWPC